MKRYTGFSFEKLIGAIFFAVTFGISICLAKPVNIEIDAAKVENKITDYLIGACIEDVNHEIYGGLYSQKIFGESFEEDDESAVFLGWTRFGGNWQFDNETSELSVGANSGAKLVSDAGIYPQNGTVRFEMKFGEQQEIAGVILNVSDVHNGADNFNGYEVSLNARTKKVIVGRHEQNWQPVAEAPADFLPEEWTSVRIEFDAKKISVFVNDTAKPALVCDDLKPLKNGTFGFRTWNSDVMFRNIWFTAEGDSDLGVVVVLLKNGGTSGQWDIFQSAFAEVSFSREEKNAFHGKFSQRISAKNNEWRVGISNRGLNRWGISVEEDETFEGSVYLRSEDFSGKIFVGLEANAPEIYRVEPKSYAKQSIENVSGEWKKFPFKFRANATDARARFSIWLEGDGTVFVDQVFLNDTADLRFHGLPVRADIANAMVEQGLKFLRYGGTMINAPEYRFKKMIGERDLRPPYKGHWYAASTNGFGIEDFLQFCETAGFTPAFAINTGETAEDVADMIEYLNGAISTPMGAQRAKNGHPAPYNVRYIEIGNEEAIDQNATDEDYDDYVKRFLLLREAMAKKDPSLKFINAAWWRPEMNGAKTMERVFRALDGKADFWDFHPWADDPENDAKKVTPAILEMQNLFKKWNPQTQMRCAIFEENGGLHNQRRALSHAIILNAVRRQSDFVLTTCPANALQPFLQNDNGWDQGQIFFTSDKVWKMPPFYAQQMAARNQQPFRIFSKTDGNLDVTATCDEAGKKIILHVVNSGAIPQAAGIKINGAIFENDTAKTTTLAGELNAENTLENPEKIALQSGVIHGGKMNFEHTFLPHSYTILEFSEE